ncbi:hypothetical protein [Halorhabdus amylolytica]|uniref:hypothetical protein n=1 Tax=Halorhabdus amylolytica TaxID=2559573 RepID=UPI0010A9CCD4|nr:hypothetical protein [Halorhabdus amylolytica]
MIDAIPHQTPIRFALATAIAVYLVLVVAWRIRSDEDPSVRMQQSSGGGTVSILVSGAMVTALGMLAVIGLTWPLAVQNPVILAGMAVVVVFHYYLEKREVSMS